MQKFPKNWDKITCINFLQRKIILNAIAYYDYNKSFLTDSYFDSLCKQLVQMQMEYTGDIKVDTEYGYMMYDFGASTAFDLSSRLNRKDKAYLIQITEYYIHNHEKSIKKTTKIERRKLF